MINEKMKKLGNERSAIRELFEQGKILKEKFGADKVYDFSIGNPSVPCPKIVNDKLIELIKNEDPTKLHGYSSAQGDKIVRDAIANYLNKTYAANIDGDLIYLTTAAAAALSISLKALCTDKDNDEVIVFTPYFAEYSVFINNANAKLVSVKPDLNNFYPDFDDFKNKISENTSSVIINSPNNPTGVLYNEDIIIKLCQILKEKEKEYNHPIYIISDEPYRELIYIDVKYPFITNYYNNSIVTYSKSISIPGERIGYALVNKNADNAKDVYAAICGAGRSQGYVCATTLFQYLIPHILGYTSDTSIYKNNAKLLSDELTKIGYQIIKPDGAFYLFIRALCDDDKEFSKKALEYNLLIVPSESFGISGYGRLAYCVSEKQILDSIPSFKKLYDYYNK